MKPITPKEALQGNEEIIPDYVFEVFNELIVKNLTCKTAIVYYKDVFALIKNKVENYPKDILDGDRIERAYRKQGWKVECDTPAYNETYAGHYTFTINS